MSDTPICDEAFCEAGDLAESEFVVKLAVARKIECQLAEVREQYQQHVAMVARKERPAYDEQQKRIAELERLHCDAIEQWKNAEECANKTKHKLAALEKRIQLLGLKDLFQPTDTPAASPEADI